jgi:hypothetical protein
MSETSAAVPRDHLADMTRERDWWMREARLRLVAFAVVLIAFAAPHLERAWLAWRAEPVPPELLAQCINPERVLGACEYRCIKECGKQYRRAP